MGGFWGAGSNWPKSLLGKAALADGVLVEAADEGIASPRIVIGENRVRVTEYAAKIGAEVYPGITPFNPGMEAEGLVHNQIYIEQKMAQGYQIVDIGPDFPRRVYRGIISINYEMERRITNGYENYVKAFIRTSKTSSIVPEP
ncbi:MAG: hypothetical protein M1132_04260 [Chloroflexi bacterium]|nr:hypothetical protein [Chloroflexota bacterium]